MAGNGNANRPPVGTGKPARRTGLAVIVVAAILVLAWLVSWFFNADVERVSETPGADTSAFVEQPE